MSSPRHVLAHSGIAQRTLHWFGFPVIVSNGTARHDDDLAGVCSFDIFFIFRRLGGGHTQGHSTLARVHVFSHSGTLWFCLLFIVLSGGTGGSQNLASHSFEPPPFL